MSVVDEIKQRLDIVEFIGSYVPLQKAGRNFKANCPFHSERTPSFVVFPETQGWHCFGACATGGDIFTFVMRQENLDFSEALKVLAQRAGVELAPIDDIELERRDELDRLRAINVDAADYFHQALLRAPQAEAARDYLARRGLTRETLDTFQLGYALDEWHALENHLLQRKQHTLEDLLTAGMLTKNESGNVYDRFRGRIIFPIRDVQGHVIGFAGRVLDDSLPKYLNSPQTPLFDKGSILYGIDLARAGIRQSECAVIVEGYMDVIVPYQCGVRNLVACMGTALTEAHIQVLKRLATKLILALDPDAAGLAAVEKGVATARQEMGHKVVPVPTATGLIRYEEQLDAEIRVLRLPDGLDPDELVLQDRARWDTLVADALPVAEHFYRMALQEHDLSTAKGKRAVVDSLLPVIAVMDNPVERTHYVQQLAAAVRMDERSLWPEVDRLRGAQDGGRPARRERAMGPTPRGAAGPGVASPPAPEGATLQLEERCLALLLRSPGMLGVALELGLAPEVFEDVRNREVFEALCRLQPEPTTFDLPSFAQTLDTALAAHVESLAQRLLSGPPLGIEATREDLAKSVSRLRKAHVAHLIGAYRFVQQDAQEQGATEDARRYNEMIDELTRAYLEIEKQFHAATLIGRKQARES